MRRRLALAVWSAIVVSSPVLFAQDAPEVAPAASGRSSCPVQGARLTARTWGAIAKPHLSIRDGVDTTYRFVIEERRWQQPGLGASLGAGVADSARGWWLCAAALVDMQQPTLVIRRAYGTVRLRADLSDLQRASRASPQP